MLKIHLQHLMTLTAFVSFSMQLATLAAVSVQNDTPTYCLSQEQVQLSDWDRWNSSLELSQPS